MPRTKDWIPVSYTHLGDGIPGFMLLHPAGGSGGNGAAAQRENLVRIKNRGGNFPTSAVYYKKMCIRDSTKEGEASRRKVERLTDAMKVSTNTGRAYDFDSEPDKPVAVSYTHLTHRGGLPAAEKCRRVRPQFPVGL